MSIASPSLPVVAIVGRPNAGKSTLFNRLIPGRLAIVDKTPGVTRDRNIGIARIARRRFLIVDTGGFEDRDGSALAESVRMQSALAAEEADVILVLLDGREGLNPDDRVLVDRVRRLGKPIVYAVNKIDRPTHEDRVVDFYALGIDEPSLISAAHGVGVHELFSRIAALVPAADDDVGWDEEDEEDVEDPGDETDTEVDPEAEGESAVAHVSRRMRPGYDGPVRLALVGRPNAGKSSLLNRLVGFERSIVDATPGTTRDALDTPLERNGRKYTLVDTAGIRRRSKVVEHVERVSNVRALHALERAEVAALVIDSTEGISDQDARIAGYAWERKRALMIVFNKWDALPEQRRRLKEFTTLLADTYPTMADVPCIGVSALTGAGVEKFFPTLDGLVKRHRQELRTPELNRVMQAAIEAHAPRATRGKPPHFFYVTQTRSSPPTITIFLSRPDRLSPDYQRYLLNCFKRNFDLRGTPVQLRLRAREH